MKEDNSKDSGDPSKTDISSLSIDPEAEQRKTGPLKPEVTGEQEQKFFEIEKLRHQRELNNQNLGKLGAFFGGQGAAQTNIAGLVAVGCFVLLAINMFFVQSGDINSLLAGLIGTTLGYLFGKNSKKDD